MSEFKKLEVDQLRVMSGAGQPRSTFLSSSLNELAESIKKQGIIQPIIVRTTLHKDYEIIAGERRWRAAQQAGLHEVPCIIETDIDDEDAFLIALTENIQREDLTPLEEADSLLRVKNALQEKGEKVTQTSLALMVDKSRDWVAKGLAVLSLCEATRNFFREYPDSLSKGHAHAMRGLETNDEIALAEKILANNWNVRRVEKEVRRIKAMYEHVRGEYSSLDDTDMKTLANRMSEKLGSPVEIDIIPKSQKVIFKITTWGKEAADGVAEKFMED